MSLTNPQHTPEEEAQLREKRSLDAIKVFVMHACEVLGMWKVICDHEFHIVTEKLEKVTLALVLLIDKICHYIYILCV